MKELKELRNIHKRETIWVVGRGPSMRLYAPGFFKSRIAIGLNAIFRYFPECTYFLSNHVGPAPHQVRKKCIYIVVASASDFAKHWHLSDLAYLKQECPDGFAYGMWQGNPGGEKENFFKVIKNIMAGKDCLLEQRGSAAHFAIEVAALMGAKKIVLAGCDAKTTKTQWSVEDDPDPNKNTKKIAGFGTEYNKAYQEGKVKDFIWYKNGAIWLANALKEYGVEVVKFNPETQKEGSLPTEEETFSMQLGGSEFPFLFYHLGYQMMDYPESRGVDIIHDFSKPFPFENESIDEIIAFHSLCRLSKEEILQTLWECYRVLVPDGGLFITVPEFAWICRASLQREGNLSPDLIERLYGNSYKWRWQFRHCFSETGLLKALRAAGFRRFKWIGVEKFKENFFGDNEEVNASVYQDGDLIVKALKGAKKKEGKKEGEAKDEVS